MNPGVYVLILAIQKVEDLEDEKNLKNKIKKQMKFCQQQQFYLNLI